MRLEDAFNKNAVTGYSRVLGDGLEAAMMNAVQKTMIRTGSELETLIFKYATCATSTSLAAMRNSEGNTVIVSKDVPEFRMKGTQPDMFLFNKAENTLTVLEIKVGSSSFDTSNSAGKIEKTGSVARAIQERTGILTKFKICIWSASSKDDAVLKLKGLTTTDNVMTGAELCNIIGAPMQKIELELTQSINDNRAFFNSKLGVCQTSKCKMRYYDRTKITGGDKFYI